MADIILINGSLNPSSNTKSIIELMSKVLMTEKYTTKVINIGDLDLPLFNPSADSNETISEIWNELFYAKAFIIGSPEYHGGYTGALKNFIDYLNSDIFRNKPIGLLVSTGGIKSGINTLNSLRIVFRNLHAQVIPQQVAISEKEFVNYTLTTPCKKSVMDVIKGIIYHLNLLQQAEFHSDNKNK